MNLNITIMIRPIGYMLKHSNVFSCALKKLNKIRIQQITAFIKNYGK